MNTRKDIRKREDNAIRYLIKINPLRYGWIQVGDYLHFCDLQKVYQAAVSWSSFSLRVKLRANRGERIDKIVEALISIRPDKYSLASKYMPLGQEAA